MARPRSMGGPISREQLPGLLALVVATVILALLSLATAIVSLTRDTSPATALRFSPNDPVALAESIDERLSIAVRDGKATPELLNKLEAAARSAIADQALNPRALRVLGSIVELRSGSDAARPLMLAAQAMSKRDLPTQLWLIEERVRAGDIPAVLSHYDIALITHPDSWSLLVPVLSAAIEDPKIRAALVPYIQNGRQWAPHFLSYAGENADPVAAANLLIATRNSATVRADTLVGANVLRRLVEAKQFDMARRLYLSLAGSNPAVLTGLGFSAPFVDPRFQPMTWSVDATSDLGVFFDSDQTDSWMTISGDRYAAGLATRKLLLLSPGTYRLDVAYSWSGAAAGTLANLRVRCGAASTAVETVLPLRSDLSQISANLGFGPDCRAQLLSIDFSVGESNHAELKITRVNLVRSGAQ